MTATDFDPTAWLAERTRIHDAATGEGPWWIGGDYGDPDSEANHVYYRRPLGDGTYDAVGTVIDNEYDTTLWEDAAAIVDAHNTQPALVEALEVVLNSETRAVRLPLAVEQKAPPYSCDPCERGDHEHCTVRVYDISWQFDCNCRKLVPHFEEVECYLVPVTAIPTALAMSPTEET